MLKELCISRAKHISHVGKIVRQVKRRTGIASSRKGNGLDNLKKTII